VKTPARGNKFPAQGSLISCAGNYFFCAGKKIRCAGNFASLRRKFSLEIQGFKNFRQEWEQMKKCLSSDSIVQWHIDDSPAKLCV
jgi:hypothetical protein